MIALSFLLSSHSVLFSISNCDDSLDGVNQYRIICTPVNAKCDDLLVNVWQHPIYSAEISSECDDTCFARNLYRRIDTDASLLHAMIVMNDLPIIAFISL